MNENKLREWVLIAKRFSQMRYPLYSLSILPVCSPKSIENRLIVKIILETFVSNKKKDRITLIVDRYTFEGQYKPEFLEESLKRFIQKCEMIKEKYIFNKDNSIIEPFNFNKNDSTKKQ